MCSEEQLQITPTLLTQHVSSRSRPPDRWLSRTSRFSKRQEWDSGWWLRRLDETLWSLKAETKIIIKRFLWNQINKKLLTSQKFHEFHRWRLRRHFQVMHTRPLPSKSPVSATIVVTAFSWSNTDMLDFFFCWLTCSALIIDWPGPKWIQNNSNSAKVKLQLYLLIVSVLVTLR